MKVFPIAVFAIASTLGGAVMASEELAQDKQCFGCHTAKPDGAAPSFRKIAQHWKDDNDAESKLVEIIRQGSSASRGPHWNKATMPDQTERPLVSQAEAKQLVKWILSH